VFKKITAVGLLLFFAFGAWCSSFAAPGSLAMAAQLSPCTQDRQALEKMDCDQPNFMCSFPAAASFSDVALASSRTHDFSKDAQCLIIGGNILGSFDEGFLPTIRPGVVSQIYPIYKVPIYLSISILLL